jgi:hypothetical protein
MPGPNRHTEGLIDFSDVTGTVTAANGEIRANLGDATKGTGIDRSVPFWGIDGFLSRPANPSNGAAQYLYFCDGNQRYAIGSRDRRFYDGLEEIDVGDRMIYAPSGIRVRLDDSEEAIEMIVPGGTKQYLSSDLAFTSIANGPKIELDTATVDVTKVGTAENVALYARIRTFLDEVQTLLEIIVGDPTALPDPVPGLATLIAVVPGGVTIASNLVAQLQVVKAAGVFALDENVASSAVLRASPT